MNDSILTADLIDRPSEWRLNMRVEYGHALEVLIFAPGRRDRFIYRNLPLDHTIAPLKSLEETVYSHPLLTSAEFMHTDCILANTRITAIPPALATDTKIDEIEDLTGTSNATMIFSPDTELAGFLRRTFPDIRLHATIPTLCRYFVATANRANGRRMLVNFHREAIDVIALDRSKLLMCNTFEIHNASDASYYILACRNLLHLDPTRDPLHTCGNAELSGATSTMLHQFGINALPMIFPSEIFASAHQARDASFDLIALATDNMENQYSSH